MGAGDRIARGGGVEPRASRLLDGVMADPSALRRRFILAEALAPPLALRRGGHRDLRARPALEDAWGW